MQKWIGTLYFGEILLLRHMYFTDENKYCVNSIPGKSFKDLPSF